MVVHFVALHELELKGASCRSRRTKEKGNVRIVRRESYQTLLPESLKPLTAGWKGFKTIGQVVSITERDGKETS